MSDAVSVIRAIVADELKALHLGDIAVVTQVYPHADEGDANNHECDVKLREGDLEMTKVPIATPHVGMVSTPHVGDVVLVSYVGADSNRPIIVGRLYSDAARPPLHETGEWRVESPLGGLTSIAVEKDETLVFRAGENKIRVLQDGGIEIAGKEDLKISVEGNVELKCADCTLDASGNVELGNGGTGVITEASHHCYYTGAPLVGSATVKAKG